MQKTSAWCDQDQVLAQLERILQSEQFRKSNRLGRFLTYVVEQTLARNPETIRSYNIAVEVFGKGENFDPGDPYVRNIARLTRQSLAACFSRVARHQVSNIYRMEKRNKRCAAEK